MKERTLCQSLPFRKFLQILSQHFLSGSDISKANFAFSAKPLCDRRQSQATSKVSANNLEGYQFSMKNKSHC